MKQFRHSLLFAALLACCAVFHIPLFAQESSGKTYDLSHLSPEELHSVSFHDDSAADKYSGNSILRSQGISPYNYVGKIPMTSSVSPSGARLYSIPIQAAAGYDLVPKISLSYNSQSGIGDAGWGWNVAGVSAITVRQATWYHDLYQKYLEYDDPEALYSLDGVPLVESSLEGFDLETLSGHVQVRRLYASDRAVSSALDGKTSASLHPVTRCARATRSRSRGRLRFS